MPDPWLKHQKQRFMRPDAARFMRPDAIRYVRPDLFRWLPARNLGNHVYERKYSADQPRVPAGNPDGGQWTDEGGAVFDFLPLATAIEDELEAGLLQFAQWAGSITDADGNAYYRPGGHHEMPRGVYSEWDLAPETRRIFDQSTTGTLPRGTVRATPEGIPFGNVWNKAHQSYNEAVEELSEGFLQRNNITPRQMTPTQAQALLKEIRESSDVRIRDFNGNMRLLQRLFPLRSGRGLD
jgi:hypothetical protein